MRLHELFEGYYKNLDILRQENRPRIPSQPNAHFNVLVNGKVWKKNGVPVNFLSRESAERAANTITKTYNKVTQVISSTLKEDSPRIRAVTDRRGITTYEVLNSEGVTVKTGMSRPLARSYLNANRDKLSKE